MVPYAPAASAPQPRAVAAHSPNMHVENLLLAVSSALTACSALQHVTMELDAALVQGAISLNSWFPLALTTAHGRELQMTTNDSIVTGSTLRMAQILCGHLAALQTEGMAVAWQASQLMGAQAEFTKEVQQWARIVAPDRIVASVETRLEDILTVSCQSSLRDLVDRHEHALLREESDPNAPHPCLPPPREGLERLEHVEECADTLQNFKNWQMDRDVRTSSARLVRALRASRNPGPMISINTSVKQHPCQFGDAGGKILVTRSDKGCDNARQALPQVPHGTKKNMSSVRAGCSPDGGPLAITERSLPADFIVEPGDASDPISWQNNKFQEVVAELHATKEKLIQANGELTVLRARNHCISHRNYGAGGGGTISPCRPATEAKASTRGRQRKREGQPSTSSLSPPRTTHDAFHDLLPPLNQSTASTNALEDGMPFVAVPPSKAKMPLLDGSVDWVRRAKNKVDTITTEHNSELAQLREFHEAALRYTREDLEHAQSDIEKMSSELYTYKEKYVDTLSQLRGAESQRDAYLTEFDGKFLTVDRQLDKLQGELSTVRHQLSTFEKTRGLIMEVMSWDGGSSRSSAQQFEILQGIITEHWGDGSQGEALRAHKSQKARANWMLVKKAVNQFIEVGRCVTSASSDDHQAEQEQPSFRIAAVCVKRLCDKFKDEFDVAGVPFGVYEFVAQRAHIEEFRCQVQALISDPQLGTQEQVTKKFTKTLSFKEDLNVMVNKSKRVYDDAFESAGGRAAAEVRFQEVNDLLRKIRKARVRCRTKQDVAFQVLGLDALFAASRGAHEKLNHEVAAIAEATGGEASFANLKGRTRSRAKVLTKYANDAACLTDVARASIVYPGLKELYDGFTYLLSRELEFNRHDLFIVEVTDRFQESADGYRDVNMNWNIDGVIVEVQLHIQQMLHAKKSCGHEIYRQRREINDAIFCACVQSVDRSISMLTIEHESCGKGVVDKNGRAALHFSCQVGTERAVRLLLQFRASPWDTDRDGILPIELAFKRGRFDVVELLFSAMTDEQPKAQGLQRLAANVAPWWCDHVVHQSSRISLQAKQTWLNAGESMLSVLRCHSGESALSNFFMLAASNGHTSRISTLLQIGFDVDPGAGKASALDLAIQGGHLEVATLLSVDGILGYCGHCSLQTVHAHLKAAASNENADYAIAALYGKADPNSIMSQCPGKRTPLMAFAASGNLDVCQALVDAKAQTHCLDKFLCSPIHYAQAMHQQHIEVFLETIRKPLPDTRLKNHEDPVRYLADAATSGCCGAVWRAVQYFHPASGDVEFISQSRDTDVYKYTALHQAVEAAKSDIDPVFQVARALLLAKADPFAKTVKGDTPLHLAAANGNRELYDCLERAIEERAGRETAARLAQTTNEFGQTPEDCLERTVIRNEKAAAAAPKDDVVLKRAGFFAFVDCRERSRYQTWAESQAQSLYDIYHHMKEAVQATMMNFASALSSSSDSDDGLLEEDSQSPNSFRSGARASRPHSRDARERHSSTDRGRGSITRTCPKRSSTSMSAGSKR